MPTLYLQGITVQDTFIQSNSHSMAGDANRASITELWLNLVDE